MGFKMTERARTAKVRREWYCDVCETQWKTVSDYDDDSEAQCPNPACAGEAAEVFKPIAIRGNAHRALEFAQHMVESQYDGVTNIRDNLQEGETAFMPPSPIQTAEAEAITREIINAGGVPEAAAGHLKADVQNFWRNSGGGQASPNPFGVPTSIDEARAMAAPAAMESRAMAADPVGLLHEAGKKGLDPTSRRNLLVHGSQ